MADNSTQTCSGTRNSRPSERSAPDARRLRLLGAVSGRVPEDGESPPFPAQPPRALSGVAETAIEMTAEAGTTSEADARADRSCPSHRMQREKRAMRNPVRYCTRCEPSNNARVCANTAPATVVSNGRQLRAAEYEHMSEGSSGGQTDGRTTEQTVLIDHQAWTYPVDTFLAMQYCSTWSQRPCPSRHVPSTAHPCAKVKENAVKRPRRFGSVPYPPAKTQPASS